jgi:hypothetical protein
MRFNSLSRTHTFSTLSLSLSLSLCVHVCVRGWAAQPCDTADLRSNRQLDELTRHFVGVRYAEPPRALPLAHTHTHTHTQTRMLMPACACLSLTHGLTVCARGGASLGSAAWLALVRTPPVPASAPASAPVHAPGSRSLGADEVHCPVCGRVVAAASINQHLDEGCLVSHQSPPRRPAPTPPRPAPAPAPPTTATATTSSSRAAATAAAGAATAPVSPAVMCVDQRGGQPHPHAF